VTPHKTAIRAATPADIPDLQSLISRSTWGLGAADYGAEQLAGALRGAFGVDTQLIDDGTFFAVEAAQGGIVGCGGWSYRRTLFGSDARGSERDASALDPALEAAKIRAFFVDPGHARRGIGTRLLEHCEAQARAQGFRRVELMSTLPGLHLYGARGYIAGERIDYPLGGGVLLPLVRMEKPL
jgi:GNAT superfamily N-acetyltransferase